MHGHQACSKTCSCSDKVEEKESIIAKANTGVKLEVSTLMLTD